MPRATIVLVDDDERIRKALGYMLGDGCEIVGEASDGEAGVKLVLELRPDFVIIDYQMPFMNGATATRLIKEQAPEIKVLGFTSSADDSLDEIKAAGADEAFQKQDLDGLFAALPCTSNPGAKETKSV